MTDIYGGILAGSWNKGIQHGEYLYTTKNGQAYKQTF